MGRDNRNEADNPADQQQPANVNIDGQSRRHRRADRQNAEDDHHHALEQKQPPMRAESVRHRAPHVGQTGVHVSHRIPPVRSRFASTENRPVRRYRRYFRALNGPPGPVFAVFRQCHDSGVVGAWRRSRVTRPSMSALVRRLAPDPRPRRSGRPRGPQPRRPRQRGGLQHRPDGQWRDLCHEPAGGCGAPGEPMVAGSVRIATSRYRTTAPCSRA